MISHQQWNSPDGMDGNPLTCPSTRQASNQSITLWKNFSIRCRAISRRLCCSRLLRQTLSLYNLYILHSWKHRFNLPRMIQLPPLMNLKSQRRWSHSSAITAWCHSLAPVIFSAIFSSTTTTSRINARSVTASSRGLVTFKSTCFHTWVAVPAHQGLCPSQRCSRSWHVNKWRIFSSRMVKSTSVDCAPRISHASVAWRPTFACTLERGRTFAKSAPLRSPHHVLSRCTCACTPVKNLINAKNAGALSQEETRCILICTSTKVGSPFNFSFLSQKKQLVSMQHWRNPSKWKIKH